MDPQETMARFLLEFERPAKNTCKNRATHTKFRVAKCGTPSRNCGSFANIMASTSDKVDNEQKKNGSC